MGKTRGVHETTPEIRNRMVGMYEAGLGLREIAVAVNCSQRTVKRWLNRFDKEGTVETRDRCGRKRATTQEQDDAIIRLATQTPITAAKAVLPALGLNCSVDTVRERLHKAGIHNWSLSRKQIQKIPIAAADEAEIQQTVWRTTGTQLGKRKVIKNAAKTKNNNSPPKKKITLRKIKPKQQTLDDDDSIPNNTNEKLEPQQNFSYSSPTQSGQVQQQINEMQTLPPPPPHHPVISNTPNQYSHPLNLMPQSQPLYHHPGLNVSQNWPLDLVQSTHHYAQVQSNPMQHEPHPVALHSVLHTHQDSQLIQHMQDQMHSQIHPQNHDMIPQKIDPLLREEEHSDQHQLSDLSEGKLNESQDAIINVCSDACSNSNCSSNENSQNSSIDDDLNSDNNILNSKKKRKSNKIKKGGKVKGTLETSVEIRNRMIGMSEAGLSTLSIALSLNRSERTVKRWLDRWHKEGNVQTKERKGRKRITTKEQDEAIVAMATQNPLTAAKYVAPALGLKCSVDTIRERLHKAGIHSWKLGKKQGEGNAVHTVHLWQPSGNRSNKIKTTGDKKRKPLNKKRIKSSKINTKSINKKQNNETPSKVIASPKNLIPEEPNIPFQNQSQASQIMPTSHDINTSAGLVQSQQHTQVSSQIVCTQGPAPLPTLPTMGPVMHSRPDCRLALTSIVPTVPNHLSNNIAYSSCMMGSSNHTEHMEQSDPMNYEPYIWSF